MNDKMKKIIKETAKKIIDENIGDVTYYERQPAEAAINVTDLYYQAKEMYENPEKWEEILSNMDYPITGWYDADIVIDYAKKIAEDAEKQIKQLAIEEKLADTKTVVTHFGFDLDNVSAVHALELWAKEKGILGEDEELSVERVPAGQVKEGFLNVDTGGHKGNRFEEDTIVIDGDEKKGIKSASASLSKIIETVPEQIVELADTRPTRISIFETRTGLSLMKYLTADKVFELANAGLLDKQLTDEQIEQYGLKEGHEKQEAIIQTAKQKVEEYAEELPNGEKVVLAPEFINAGSAVAYEMGVNYYVSTSDHKDKDGNADGVTIAITSKPGVKLPEDVIEYGKELVEEFRIDEKTSGAFVHPNGQMVVVGGPKNPDVKMEGTSEEVLKKISEKFGVRTHKANEVEEIAEDIKSEEVMKELADMEKSKEEEKTEKEGQQQGE